MAVTVSYDQDCKVIKCDFCMSDGQEPNCVKSCPKGAIHVEEV